MNQETVEIRRWFDRHLHVRDGEMLETVLPCTLNQGATGAIIMGNLEEPISTIERAVRYRERITSLIPAGCDFNPRMTLYLTDDITPEEVVRGFREGAWYAVKLYMANQQGLGGTTGSKHGVRNLKGRYPVFEAMEREGIPLLGHFEAVEPEVDEFDREIVSVERDLIPILRAFPSLKVVFEHITDGRATDFVAEVNHPIFATVTAHHLMFNRNALFTGGLNSVNWCKPVLKREEHRLRVREYVTSGHNRFGAGTDSAPHDMSVKSQCHGCAAGIFTAPVAVELYTTIFEEDNALQHLEGFLSTHFVDIYGMGISDETMVIRRESLLIPETVGTVKVFMGGEALPWKLVT